MQTLVGMQLGNYDVIRRIRVGGMGAVYEGRQRSAFDRRVAIKVILGNYATDREMRRRFAREARTIAQLHHPHILPLIEFGDEQGILYLVMPFIEGGTLTGYLRRSLPDLSEVAAIFLQLLDAVEYAHDEGLIHRDIKSSNVLLEIRRDSPPNVYLADFGLVRYSEQQVEEELIGQSLPLDQIPGTPHYMAPEQTRGIVTISTDIYALGVLLYQMLVGELPYDHPDDVKVVKMHLYAPLPSPCDCDVSIPTELGEVVRKAMAKRAESRFGNVAELRQAFLAAIEGPVLVVENDSKLSEADEFIITPTPVRHISLPLSPLPSGELPPKSRLKHHSIASHFPHKVKQSMKRNANHSRKLFMLCVAAATLVPITLLVLLLMPRLSGFSFFPMGFPVFGTAPYATISVTVQSKTVQDTYLLTASPHVGKPNLTTRMIPDRSVTSTAVGNQTVASTGFKSVAGTQAGGSLLFENSGHSAYSIPVGFVFTATRGIEVKLMQSVVVPPRKNGQNGSISAPALAVLAGITGNIAPNDLNTICCDHQLTVSNPQPFSGGVDSRGAHIVIQADIDGVKNALTAQLQRQALQQLQKQISANEIEAEQPTYITNVVSDSAPGSQVEQVSVQVSVSATTFVYNQTIARLVAVQLLNKEASVTLNSNYILKGVPTIAKPKVVQQSHNGIIYLSVSTRGLWIHRFSSQQIGQWQQSIKGATPILAKTYLATQPGVAGVEMQLPFGADHLPTSIDQIRVVLVNV
jgi:serine/threonine protein kinase